MSARNVARPVVVGLAVGATLLAIAGGFRLYESEPMDDMCRRADRVPLPKDFVLVSESYTSGASGLMGAVPHLHRVYHASWPALCDSLRDVGGRLGAPTGLAPVPEEYAGQMCNAGAALNTGWLGLVRNYRHYEVRLTAWRPGVARGPMFERPRGFIVLYPRRGQVPEPNILIPEGRARVEIELIAHRGW